MQATFVGMAMVFQAAGILVLLMLIPLAIGLLMKRFHSEHPLSAHSTGVQLYHERRHGERRHS